MFNLRQAQALKEKDCYGFFDDFFWYVITHNWTSLKADATTTMDIDASYAGGRVLLYTDTTDNNEVAIGTTQKNFKDLANQPMVFEAKIQYAEGATNKANVCAGFCSVMTSANTLVDNGGGMVTTYDGHVIYKIDGETVWRCGSSRGTTQYTTTSTTTAGGTNPQVLRIESQPEDSTTITTRYYVDDVQLRDTNGIPIVHTQLLASAAAMQAGVAAKTGGSNAESIYVDYIAAYQRRVATL
ncbi:MAG: hypothetical protein ACXU95_04850 [Isosphaeraceae bacterium]